MPKHVKGERKRGRVAEPTQVPMETPDRTDAGSDVVTVVGERRCARSGAPSIDTRAAPGPLAVHHDQETEEQDDAVLYMQTKPRIVKQEFDDDRSTSHSVQGSFSGPNTALKEFGQELKAMNDALAEIQVRGISHVANLPELVLVGDQSSGKSSLMSAIAGLSLPRSTGACTRCPLHIRVSKSDEWSCRVFLRQDYEFVQPQYLITTDDVTNTNKFPPWKPLPVHQQARHEFKTVRDKFDSEELETVLHCAQVAILNPSTPFSFFIPKLKGEAPDDIRWQHADRVKEKADKAEAQFSPNTVALEVKGPDLADLNFYDLPGVFVTTKRREDEFLEQVVKNLACDYISRPNAIILWAVPMNVDAENSYAKNLIRKLRAENRCVGVMTKADLLPQDLEASASWLAMLDNRAHKTGLGYFITSRQEGDLESQNKREEAFFNRVPDMEDSRGTWPEVFEPFKERCGTENLKAFLSLKLGEEFSKVLPEVKIKVNKRLNDLSTQLEKYPDPPSNPELEITRSLSNFSMQVKERLRQQDFMSVWDCRAAEPFKTGVLSLKPKFNVSEPSRSVVIDLVGSPSPPVGARKRPIQGTAGPMTPSKRPRGEPGSGATVKVENTPTTCHSVPAVPFQLSTPRSKDLMGVRALIRRNAIPGQPGLVPPSVYEPLYLESAKQWSGHLDLYIFRTFEWVESEIMVILDASFQSLKSREVYKESVHHVKAFISKHTDEMRKQLYLMYNLEAGRLFTKDEDSLARNKATEKKILERHRFHCRLAARINEPVGKIPKWEDLSEDQVAKEAAHMQKEAKSLGPDPYDQEVTVAAYVRGYYLTAASRFIDHVCIHFMSGLLPEISTQIDRYLDEKLGLLSGSGATREVLDRLVSEGVENARKREELRAEKQRLVEALDIIIGLETRLASTPRASNGYMLPPGGVNGTGNSRIQDYLNQRNGNGNSVARGSVAHSVTQYGET